MLMGLPGAAPKGTVMGRCIKASGGGIVLTRRTIAGKAYQLATFFGQDKEYLATLGQNGRDYVARHFSDEGQFEALRKVIEEVMAQAA
jgi:hypothetical protein